MASINNRNLIVEVRDMLLNLNACIRIQNLETGKFVKKEMNYSLIIKEQDQFFVSLPKMVQLNCVKALVFHLFEFDNILPPKSYAFRKRCVDFCERHGTFCFFTDESLLCPLAAVSQTKTMVAEGEGVMVIRPMCHDTNAFFAMKLIRENGRYIIRDAAAHITVDECRRHFMGNFVPKKVIIIGPPNLYSLSDKILPQLKCLFSKHDPTILADNKDVLYTAALITKVSLLMGEQFTPYNVAIPCVDMFDIRIDGEKSLWKVETFEVLPYEKTMTVEVGNAKSISIYQKTMKLPPNLLKEITLSTFKSKTVKVTLKINYNSIPEFSVEEITKKLPSKPEKARFIFGKQNFSVYIYDEKEQEYILEDSDGLEMTPIYIAFTQKKPIIGKAAMEAYGSKPKFVVFDLIKICSVENAYIINPKWGFRFFKDDQSLKIQMETLDGEKGAETAFLLALFLRNGLKRIQSKTGKRMEEIEIKFDGFIPNEILKETFVKAGKLMKVTVIFV